MKTFKNYLIFGLIIAIAAIFFIKDAQVDKWREKYETEAAQPPDTVAVIIKQTDTVFVHTADTVSTETEIKGDTVFVYKVLTDTVQQPLFTLSTTVNSRTETFKYDFNYHPLKISLAFNDKYDLRKGFTVFTDPNIGNVVVDWGSYEPSKKEKKFKFSAGVSYQKKYGAALLAGLHWKKNEVGVLLLPNSIGFYYKRAFINLF